MKRFILSLGGTLALGLILFAANARQVEEQQDARCRGQFGGRAKAFFQKVLPPYGAQWGRG